MPESAPATAAALEEGLALSAEIIRDIESGHGPVRALAFKAVRLARLLNDPEFEKIMRYEVAGYPVSSSGKLDETVSRLATKADRVYESADRKTGEVRRYIYVESLSDLEQEIASTMERMAKSDEASIKGGLFGSQFDFESLGRAAERDSLRDSLRTLRSRLEGRRAMMHDYATRKYHELKFSHIVEDVFARVRGRVDNQIGTLMQDARKRFATVHDNLRSENPEDWSNAVHSCRRVLQDLADAVFAPTDQTRTRVVGGRSLTVHLGRQQYINRIMAFVEDSSSSARFQEIVGSHLSFLGNRLDSVFKAAQKGSHATLVTREEADRYVVYTYMIAGDILSLCYGQAKPCPGGGA